MYYNPCCDTHCNTFLEHQLSENDFLNKNQPDMWIIILTSDTVSAQSATYLIRYNILFLTPLSTHFICIFTRNHAKLSLALSQKAESMKRGLDEPNDNPSANARTWDTEVVNNWYPLPHITVALTASGSLDNWHLPRLVVPEQVIMSRDLYYWPFISHYIARCDNCKSVKEERNIWCRLDVTLWEMGGRGGGVLEEKMAVKWPHCHYRHFHILAKFCKPKNHFQRMFQESKSMNSISISGLKN